MKINKSKIFRYIAVNLSLVLCVTLFSNSERFEQPVKSVALNIGAAAAAAIMPEALIPYHENEVACARSVVTATNKSAETTVCEPSAAVNTTYAKTTAAASPAGANAKGKISEQKIGTGGANLSYKNVHISNHTGKSVDLKKQLSIKPDINILKNGSPQVLIVHTHATESYFPKTAQTYPDSWSTKSTDKTKSVISLGTIIAEQLNKNGIKTLHDKTQYDKNSYSGSYERCRAATKATLKKYPSIDVVIDIHRDAITYDNATKVKPTAVIGGKKAAQIMIATGCQSGKVTKYPDWIYNFRFAIRVQQECEKSYPGLARPMYFVSKKYNHDLCRGSILVEVGSEANVLSEAQYSARLLSNALINVFEQ